MFTHITKVTNITIAMAAYSNCRVAAIVIIVADINKFYLMYSLEPLA